MSLTKSQVQNLQSKGIHYSRQVFDVEDLVYSYSTFRKSKKSGLPESLQDHRLHYMEELKKCPLIGPNASDLGYRIYNRGVRFDAV